MNGNASYVFLLVLVLMSFIHAGLTQERPKPVARVDPDRRVFRGETVTLTCHIQQTGVWQYSWYKYNTQVYRARQNQNYIISSVDWSHGGVYSCRGSQSEAQGYSPYSAGVILTVSDKPRPTLTVNPESSVFTGDTVTLSCDVGQLTGWTIIWRKDSNTDSTGDATKTIRSVSVSDGGRYQCRAKRGNYYSEYSNAAEITVKERPKPVARVDPDRRVFRGETVTLTCHIQQTGVWRYSWNKDNKLYRAGQNQNYIISSVDPSHGGVYSCRGTQSEAPTHTQMSDGVTLTVSDLPRSTLTVTPDSPVFTGETVTLTCVIESNHSDWRYEWHKDSVMLQTSDGYTVNRDTLTIRGANESDQGQYWCRGQIRSVSSQSSSVSLSVTDGDVILGSSVDPVIEGDTLTLHCLHRSTNSPILGADFYKDRSLVQNQTTGEMNITTVSKSHEGFYSCKTERGASPKSWISVRGQISVFSILSFLLAACPYLLATVVLLFKCCRARFTSTQDHSQYGVTE
ncbi:carcinoembryonic antigen-related cell adhesion molecule 5-like [Onychostoma macrolepis]|uniref:carcinoembryonic antigen-related cell adhesion molecule 5-like n=1 Tax=Onychostoma macrolepis TaxID=369639 RepID=UPI00272C4AE1|nr:carcinoembryonic antigen-related cell adhesion molecule 5-like [Onychostoma macrolepis]